MPNYAKFIKDVMSKKKKLQEFEIVKLTEECSAILQIKLPQKLKDSGSFTILCFIGGAHVNKALCDLRANRSLTYPRGIVEDVLVKLDKFMFPADFVILFIEEDQDAPLIFGRLFLATGKALIDVHKGELTLRVGGEAVICNIYNAIRANDEVSTCKSIDIIDSCIAEVGVALEDLPKVKEASQEKLKGDEYTEVIPSSPAFKEFSSHLCYAFFCEKSTYPGISPTICMYKILMEESYTPYVDHQRKPNQAMKEVVKNEVLKSLNVGVIYAISDSSWVSPMQVVPKKIGIQMCMMAIFADIVEEIMEVFMDDFSAFEIKKALVTTPIMIVLDWKEPFELMCDASDYAVGAVLGQRREMKPDPIGTKVVVFTDHATICYLSAKKDAKPRLLEEKKEDGAIKEAFSDEKLFKVNSVLPWFADINNFLSGGVLPPGLNYNQKKKFFHDIKFFQWDDPCVFKRCAG
ncbi:uncharacterized protein [Primulina huaijiensis]|uniref:uncharacterized protein n=1 Tax=Primulina huaijiensis TaxID=1492673 RepID=UPI003CC6DE21